MQLGTFEQTEFQDIFGCLLVALFCIGIKVKVSASQKEQGESKFSAKKEKKKRDAVSYLSDLAFFGTCHFT